MFLVFNKALVARSSTKMIFFKIHQETKRWTPYHTIPNMRGTVFFIRGNVRIQITTERKIYFYLIDPKTLMPELENVMYNFINCSSLLIGSMKRYAVGFKASQKDFEVFTRKQYHNFKVCIDSNNFEGAVGCELPLLNSYAMAQKLTVGIYDEMSFANKDKWTI